PSPTAGFLPTEAQGAATEDAGTLPAARGWGVGMAGYFGTEKQRSLQAGAEQAHGWMMATPGACNPVRLLGSDDPDALGWDTVLDILARDGMFAFRMAPAETAQEAAARPAPHGYAAAT